MGILKKIMLMEWYIIFPISASMLSADNTLLAEQKLVQPVTINSLRKR